MSITQTIDFTDNKAALANPEMFISIEIDLPAVIKSWQLSVFSYEWLHRDGSIKSLGELSEADQDKRKAVETALDNGDILEKPVLGIGIQDNIEIGSGRATLLTLADMGHKTIPVHIPKSNESDFKDFLAQN